MVRFNAGREMPDYDRLCIQSWVDCGFRILAINGRNDIPALAVRYPEIEFIMVERNAREIFGRDTPFIADMMSVLAAQPEPVLGIINSDLLFEPAPGWQRLRSLTAQKAVVTGQRCDVRTLAGGTLHPYWPGFDYFFFDHKAAETLSKTDQPFCIGLPWWDYWCPLTLSLRGYELLWVTRPVVLHLFHDSQTDARTKTWRRLAQEFARSVLQESKTCDRLPPDWKNLTSLCQEFGKAPDAEIDNGAFDEKIIRLSEFAVPLIGKTPIVLDKLPSVRVPYVPGTFFIDIPNRVTAGEALYQAIWEEKHERPDAALPLYGKALKKSPLDPGVLSAFGNFLFRRGDLERAAILLGQAVERAPDSAMLHNSLGSVYGRMGRMDWAIGCFERALEADPLDGASYYNLVVALYPDPRHAEIVGRLEDLMHRRPDFPGAPEWHGRIRETLNRLKSPLPL